MADRTALLGESFLGLHEIIDFTVLPEGKARIYLSVEM